MLVLLLWLLAVVPAPGGSRLRALHASSALREGRGLRVESDGRCTLSPLPLSPRTAKPLLLLLFLLLLLLFSPDYQGGDLGPQRLVPGAVAVDCLTARGDDEVGLKAVEKDKIEVKKNTDCSFEMRG
jgi:hypothetical protein